MGTRTRVSEQHPRQVHSALAEAVGISRGAAGWTLVELVIAATILVLMMTSVTALMLSGSNAAKLTERNNRALEISQDLVDGVRRDLRSAVRIFGSEPLDLAYRARLETWVGVPPLSSSTPPTLAVGSTFKKDVVGSEKTGNELFFARHSWSAEYQAAAGAVYRYDVYRLVRYFLTAVDGGPKPGTAAGLNLVKWISEPLVDGTQIDSITTPAHQAQVLMHLLNGTADRQGALHPKVTVVWRLGQDPATAGTFRQILGSGSLSNTPSAPRPATWTVLRDGKQSSPGLLAQRHHSIATNYAMPSYGVSRFGIANDAGQGFPHGFEVQLIGPASARQILLHIAIVSTNRAGQKAHATAQAVLGAREL